MRRQRIAWPKHFPLLRFNRTGIAWALAISTSLSFASSLQLKPAVFNQLPGWQQAKLIPSLKAFQQSCKLFLRQTDATPVGTPSLRLTVKDWEKPCKAAMALKTPTEKQARHFFVNQFKPYAVFNGNNNRGLFTAYYLPSIDGSLTRSKTYSVPIYARPNNLITAKLGLFRVEFQGKRIAGKVVDGHLYPYNITRQQINQGAITHTAKVIAWVKTRAARYVLQVQGSGYVQLTSGKKLLLGYNGANGQTYYPIGLWLMQHHQIARKQMSMPKIYHWLLNHPRQGQRLLNKNKAFVFFTVLPYQAPLGTQGVPLTNGYSLAVDGRVMPLGVPLWVSTKLPKANNLNQTTPLKRLFIAQDTGGAINGVIRADIYLGDLPHAAIIAGHMKNRGSYWLFLPKQFAV